MARHFTWCLARSLSLANRSTAIRLTVPSLKASLNVATNPNLKNVAISRKATDIEEPRDIEKFEVDSKKSIQIAKTALTKLLSITADSATRVLKDYPSLKSMSKQMLYQNFDMLRENGVFKSTIKTHKFLLATETKVLSEKIKSIKALDIDINEAVYLFRLTKVELQTLQNVAKIDASYLPARNRIYYLSERLKCDISKICDVLSYHPFMLWLPSPKLLSFTEYMLESGFYPEHILSDMLIYRYSLETLKLRINRAKKLGVHPIRPWIIRCSESVWTIMEKKAATYDTPIDTNMTAEEYICEILDCTMEDTKYLILRNPKILKMSIKKLVRNLKLLRDTGYTFHDIVTSPLVILWSTARLKKRFDELAESSMPRPRLWIFSLTDKQYRKQLNNRLTLLKAQTES